MTVVRACLAVTGVSAHFMLCVAGGRHLGRAWRRVMVIGGVWRPVQSRGPITIGGSKPRAVFVVTIELFIPSCSSWPGNRQEEGALFESVHVVRDAMVEGKQAP